MLAQAAGHSGFRGPRNPINGAEDVAPPSVPLHVQVMEMLEVAADFRSINKQTHRKLFGPEPEKTGPLAVDATPDDVAALLNILDGILREARNVAQNTLERI
mgnify:CR=1 FL=1